MLALVTKPAVTFIELTEVAKMARTMLRESFPGVKFSVRSKSYSGGSSISASWTDGPTTAQVDAIIGHMHGTSFDGMTDSTIYLDPTEVDGIGLVRYGNGYMFCHRRESAELTARVVAYMDRKGIDTTAPAGWEAAQTVYATARRTAVDAAGNLIVFKSNR